MEKLNTFIYFFIAILLLSGINVNYNKNLKIVIIS